MTKRRRTPPGARLSTRFWATAFAFFWPAFSHSVARAESPEANSRHRVLIVADELDDPLLNRVLAEVRAIPGVEVVVRRPVASLDADARTDHAEAAIRRLPSGTGVEVWMADATTGRSLIRQIVVDESREGPDQSMVALQTAELLRTSLSLAPAPAAVTAAPPSPPSEPVGVASPAPVVGENALLVGVGSLHSRGGVSPALQTWLSFQHLWSRGLGITLDLSAPLARGTIGGPEGKADVGAIFAGGGLLARLKSDRRHLTIAASLGGACALVLVKGRPSPSLAGASTSVYTGLVYLRVHGGWNPTRWLGFGAAGVLGTTTSRIRIQFVDRNAGEWGTPIAAAVLYSELGWD